MVKYHSDFGLLIVFELSHNKIMEEESIVAFFFFWFLLKIRYLNKKLM